MDEYNPGPPSAKTPNYTPTSLEHAGPKRLSIEDYKRRQLLKKEAEITKPKPVINPPKLKKRGGRIQRLRVRLGHLTALIRDEENPPPWATACKIHEEIQNIKDELKKKKKKN